MSSTFIISTYHPSQGMHRHAGLHGISLEGHNKLAAGTYTYMYGTHMPSVSDILHDIYMEGHSQCEIELRLPHIFLSGAIRLEGWWEGSYRGRHGGFSRCRHGSCPHLHPCPPSGGSCNAKNGWPAFLFKKEVSWSFKLSFHLDRVSI